MTTPKRKLDPAVVKRIRIEKRIVRTVVTEAHRLGYEFIIDNGGGLDEEITTSGVSQTMKEMMATDDDRLYITKDGLSVGWVHFVYGNDGWDVISDYTVNLETLGVLDKAQTLAAKLES